MDFLTWCSEQGIRSDSVDIKPTEYGGHGLFLNTTCTNSAPLVHIPPHLLITASSLLNDSPPSDKSYSATFIRILDTVLKPDTLALDERIKLPGNEKTTIRLFLTYEIDQARRCNEQQSTSFWKPYIDNLPPLSFFQQNHVLFLDTDDDTNNLFVLLEGTSMASSIRAKRASLQREWEQLQSVVPWDLTLEDWMYADVLFWSRVVALTTNGDDDDDDDDASLAMIPFFDFANHRLDPNIRWQLGKQKDEGLDLVPFDVPIERGQELCLTYGAKSNQELLFLHGFTLDQNPTAGQVTLSLTPFLNPGMGQDGALKWQWLQQQDTPPFKPVLVLARPSKVDTFGHHTGWSFESICMMYLAALDNDDGLEWTMMDDDNDSSPTENIADDLDKLHLSSQDNHGVQLSLDGKPLATWNDLSAAVLALAHAPVIQLRVTMMLLDASQYHLQQIMAHDEFLNENDNHDLSKSPLVPHIVRYRDEERELLQQSVTTLSRMAEELMDNEIVKEYLDNMNVDGDGD